MEDRDLNNLGVNEKDSLSMNDSNTSVEPIIEELNSLMSQGAALEQAVASLVQQGVPENELSSALQQLGYSPDAVMDLLQKIEIAFNEESQSQMEQPAEQQGQMNPEDMSNEDIEAMAQEAAQQMDAPEMQFGGPNTTARGPLGYGVPRPLYMPPIPKKPNLINAAYMLSDAAGELFSKKDNNNDGLRDGTFQDWSAKKARFKESQLANRTYDVDYGTNNPGDYYPTWEDLASGKLRTKEQVADDSLKYSKLDFDPGTNQYTGALLNSQRQAKMLGKDQLKNAIGLKDFVSNISDYSSEDIDMLKEGSRYAKGRGMFMDESGSFGSYSPETQATLSPEERRQQQASFRDIMLGNQRLTPIEKTESKLASEPMSVFENTQRSIMQTPNYEEPMVSNKPDFRTWYAENSKSLMGKNLNEAQSIYDNAKFQYGGDLPKAQFGPPGDFIQGFDPNNPFGLPDFSQMGQTSYINPATGQPWGTGASGIKSTPATTPAATPATSTTADAEQPTITRKRNLSNAFDQAENFLKNNPAMKAYGDVSQAAVMGANFANELFSQKEYDDYRNKLRNTTMADKTDLAVVDPVNKRGTFDVNLGLAEPDNLVDYYDIARYGAEIKQEGGEIEVDNDTLAALIAAGADIQIL